MSHRPAHKFTAPDVGKLRVLDPRTSTGAPVPLIAFYFPGREEPWDRLCKASFLGNFFELEQPISINPQGNPHAGVRFTNTEAAFQALKFWPNASQFAPKSGGEAFDLKKQLKGKEDWTYSGYGNNWKAMEHCLRKKFEPGSKCAQHLLATQDAFLLEHNSVSGRDFVWSDNSIGDGTNWLGLQLMMIRDELSGRQRQPGSWTAYAGQRVDLQSGAPLPAHHEWKALVKQACDAVPSSAVGGGAVCGCGKPTWNGQWNELCSRSCQGPKLQDPSLASSSTWFADLICSLFCCCSSSTKKPSASRPLPAPPGAGSPPICGCGKPTWNGQWNELCRKSCQGPRLSPMP